MNAKLVNVFLEAAVQVLTAEIGGPIVRGEISLQESGYTTNEVNVHLAMMGQVEGAIMFAMSRETALKIVSRMIGQTMEELDDLAQSGIAELGNVIAGRAGTLLAPLGYSITISVPTLVIGRARMAIQGFRRLVVPLGCADGAVEIHLALRELPGSGK